MRWPFSKSSPNESLFDQFYDAKLPDLIVAKKTLAEDIRFILKNEGVEHLTLQCRIKDKSSACRKFRDKDYNKPEQVTDLLGARIVTLLETDILPVARAVSEKLLEVDRKNSSDKLVPLTASNFGYRSYHLTGVHTNSGQVVELQIRSALQHVWAETEHKMRYKASAPLEPQRQREFALVAAMLEIADTKLCEMSLCQAQSDLDEKTVEDFAALVWGNANVSPNKEPHERVRRSVQLIFDFGINDLKELEATLETIDTDALTNILQKSGVLTGSVYWTVLIVLGLFDFERLKRRGRDLEAYIGDGFLHPFHSSVRDTLRKKSVN